VPLAGRAIGQTRQGDVAKVLAMYATLGGFEPVETVSAPEAMTCARAKNPNGKVLEFCSFPGGHDANITRLRYGFDRVTGGN
jgi:polyhydroxybutyrate depolymerase